MCSSAVPLIVHFARKEKGSDVPVPVHGLWPMAWLDSQELGRNTTGKLVENVGKEVCGYTFPNRQKINKDEDTCVQCECSPNGDDLNRGVFHH